MVSHSDVKDYMRSRLTKHLEKNGGVCMTTLALDASQHYQLHGSWFPIGNDAPTWVYDLALEVAEHYELTHNPPYVCFHGVPLVRLCNDCAFEAL